MNPAIVIPTYWAADPTDSGVYDHATAVDEPLPELARCLDSLDDVRGVIRVIVLLVARPGVEDAARARVNAIVRDHEGLNPLVIGTAEARLIEGCIENAIPGLGGETVALRGYGAIRNMGLATCAMLGHDVCVFMDDDEVALGPDYLVDAVYGLGQLTRQDLKILAKTGHFIDANGSHLADVSKPKLWERWWSKRREFNEWMEPALEGVRICRSNYACGGCMAIHAAAFARVPFDPAITRGEDLDYLLNLRLCGLEMWFDRSWYVRHLPPKTPDDPNRFLQDIFRWFYERAKLGFCSRQPSLSHVSAESLMPYPGKWLSPELDARVAHTSFARAVLGPNRGYYLRIWQSGRSEARTYAMANASSYTRLLNFWPSVIDELWDSEELAARVVACSRASRAGKAARGGGNGRPAAPVSPRDGASQLAPARGTAKQPAPAGAAQTKGEGA